MSEKIQAHHLERKAVLYIRQSTAFQMQNNLESQKLQYGMEARLRELGWRDIEVIDEDLGCSAAGGVERSGFERMVAEVCLGRVGAVAAREVSRFARNSRDWQQLVEVCRVVDTLLIDQETVYSPRLGNDRLFLGLKGSLNEYELDLFRQRAVEARCAKAKRGELIVSVPTGFLKTEEERLEKDPDRRVQEAILLVFRKFFEEGSVRRTMQWFIDKELQVPVRPMGGETEWKRASYGRIYNVLTNPAYAGAYAFGKTELVRSYRDGKHHKEVRRKPRERWLALIPGTHEGYIRWEEYEQIQKMIADNNTWDGSPGAAKRGLALLAGIVRCRRCGRKVMVHYTGRDRDMLSYFCHRGRLDQGEPRCISFGGTLVDRAIAGELLTVVQPAAREAALVAQERISQSQDEVLAALKRDLEAACYRSQRAERQFHAADPENRLVAGELERRWNQALEEVQMLEQRIRQHEDACSQEPSARIEDFFDLERDLESVWNDPHSDASLKKRIVRTLIHEVIADVDAAAGEVVLVIHWKGGVHTELHIPRRKRGCCRATSKDIVDAVRVLARICNDRELAGFLNRNGMRTGTGNRWTQARVTSMRTKRQIPCFSAEVKEAEGWMTLTEGARFLSISPGALRLAVEEGRIAGEHPLPDGPWVFQRAVLETEAARQVVERARRRTRHPGKANPAQGNLDFSNT